MNIYVVSFIPDYSTSPVCRVMTGIELAEMYGFSDCNEVDIKHVWKFMRDGDLVEVDFHGSCKAPFNQLVIETFSGHEIERIEWPEH